MSSTRQITTVRGLVSRRKVFTVRNGSMLSDRAAVQGELIALKRDILKFQSLLEGQWNHTLLVLRATPGNAIASLMGKRVV